MGGGKHKKYCGGLEIDAEKTGNHGISDMVAHTKGETSDEKSHVEGKCRKELREKRDGGLKEGITATRDSTALTFSVMWKQMPGRHPGSHSSVYTKLFASV